MQVLSALDAVTPAIARTKVVLFSPFRKGRSWKLAATGYLSFAGTIYIPFPLIYLAFLPGAYRTGGHFAASLVVAGVMLATILYTVFFYLCSRIQFAFFDIVLNRGEFVAPPWRRYGPVSWPFTAWKAALGTILTALCALPLARYAVSMVTVMHRMNALKPGQPPPPDFMSGLFAGYAAVYLVFGLLFLVGATLSAFLLPSLALENTTLTEALRRFGKLIKGEPGQFAAYVLIKAAIGVVGYFALIVAFEIALVVLLLVLGIGAFIVGFLLHIAGVPVSVLMVIGFVLFIPLELFLSFYGLFLAVGTLFTFTQAYTLYFLGGRYPLLGDLLDRSTPPPPYLYPPPGYAQYYPPLAYPVPMPPPAAAPTPPVDDEEPTA